MKITNANEAEKWNKFHQSILDGIEMPYEVRKGFEGHLNGEVWFHPELNDFENGRYQIKCYDELEDVDEENTSLRDWPQGIDLVKQAVSSVVCKALFNEDKDSVVVEILSDAQDLAIYVQEYDPKEYLMDNTDCTDFCYEYIKANVFSFMLYIVTPADSEVRVASESKVISVSILYSIED